MAARSGTPARDDGKTLPSQLRAADPGLRSAESYELFQYCGCPKNRLCICNIYAEGCGKCEQCVKNKLFYQETGQKGDRTCKLATPTDNVKISKYRIEFPRTILALKPHQVFFGPSSRQLVYTRQVARFAQRQLEQERKNQDKILADRANVSMQGEDELEQMFTPGMAVGSIDTDLAHGTRQRVRADLIQKLVYPALNEAYRALYRIRDIGIALADHYKALCGWHCVRIARGYLGRCKARNKRMQLLRHFGALRVQAVWRGYLDRSRVIPALIHKLRMRAANRIQIAWRAYIGARTFRMRTKARVWRKKVRGTTRIQAVWRGYFVRKRLPMLRDRAMAAKASFENDRRTKLTAARARREAIKHAASINIQRIWRGVVGRRAAYARKNASTVSHPRLAALADSFLASGDLWGFLSAVNGELERAEVRGALRNPQRSQLSRQEEPSEEQAAGTGEIKSSLSKRPGSGKSEVESKSGDRLQAKWDKAKEKSKPAEQVEKESKAAAEKQGMTGSMAKSLAASDQAYLGRRGSLGRPGSRGSVVGVTAESKDERPTSRTSTRLPAVAAAKQSHAVPASVPGPPIPKSVMPGVMAGVASPLDTAAPRYVRGPEIDNYAPIGQLVGARPAGVPLQGGFQPGASMRTAPTAGTSPHGDFRTPLLVQQEALAKGRAARAAKKLDDESQSKMPGQPKSPSIPQRKAAVASSAAALASPGDFLHNAPDGSHPLDALVDPAGMAAIEAAMTVRRDKAAAVQRAKGGAGQWASLSAEHARLTADPVGAMTDIMEANKRASPTFDFSGPPGTAGSIGNLARLESAGSVASMVSIEPYAQGIDGGSVVLYRAPPSPDGRAITAQSSDKNGYGVPPSINLLSVPSPPPRVTFGAGRGPTIDPSTVVRAGEYAYEEFEEPPGPKAAPSALPLLGDSHVVGALLPPRVDVTVGDVIADLQLSLNGMSVIVTRRALTQLLLDEKRMGWGKWSKSGATGVKNTQRRARREDMALQYAAERKAWKRGRRASAGDATAIELTLQAEESYATIDGLALARPLDRYSKMSKDDSSLLSAPTSLYLPSGSLRRAGSDPQPRIGTAPGGDRPARIAIPASSASVLGPAEGENRPGTAPSAVQTWRHQSRPMHQRTAKQRAVIDKYRQEALDAEARNRARKQTGEVEALMKANIGFGAAIVVEATDASAAVMDVAGEAAKVDAIAQRLQDDSVKLPWEGRDVEEWRAEQNAIIAAKLNKAENMAMSMDKPYDDGWRSKDERLEAQAAREKVMALMHPFEAERAKAVSGAFITAIISTVAERMRAIEVAKRSYVRMVRPEDGQDELHADMARAAAQGPAPSVLIGAAQRIAAYANALDAAASAALSADLYRYLGRPDLSERAISELEHSAGGSIGLIASPLEALQARVDPTLARAVIDRRKSPEPIPSRTKAAQPVPYTSPVDDSFHPPTLDDTASAFGFSQLMLSPTSPGGDDGSMHSPSVILAGAGSTVLGSVHGGEEEDLGWPARVFAEEATLRAHGLGVPAVRSLMVDVRGLDGPVEPLLVHALVRAMPVPRACSDTAKARGLVTQGEYAMLLRVAAADFIALGPQGEAEAKVLLHDADVVMAEIAERESRAVQQSAGAADGSPVAASGQRAPSREGSRSPSSSRPGTRGSSARPGSRSGTSVDRGASKGSRGHSSRSQREIGRTPSRDRDGRTVRTPAIPPPSLKKQQGASKLPALDRSSAGEVAARILTGLPSSLATMAWRSMLHTTSSPLSAMLRSQGVQTVNDLAKFLAQQESLGMSMLPPPLTDASLVATLKRLLGVLLAAHRMAVPAHVKSLYQMKRGPSGTLVADGTQPMGIAASKAQGSTVASATKSPRPASLQSSPPATDRPPTALGQESVPGTAAPTPVTPKKFIFKRAATPPPEPPPDTRPRVLFRAQGLFQPFLAQAPLAPGLDRSAKVKAAKPADRFNLPPLFSFLPDGEGIPAPVAIADHLINKEETDRRDALLHAAEVGVRAESRAQIKEEMTNGIGKRAMFGKGVRRKSPGKGNGAGSDGDDPGFALDGKEGERKVKGPAAGNFEVQQQKRIVTMLANAPNPFRRNKAERLADVTAVITRRLGILNRIVEGKLHGLGGQESMDAPLEGLVMQVAFLLPLPSPKLVNMARERAIKVTGKGTPGTARLSAREASTTVVSFSTFLAHLALSKPLGDVLTAGLRSTPNVVARERRPSIEFGADALSEEAAVLEPMSTERMEQEVHRAMSSLLGKSKGRFLVAERAQAAAIVARPWIEALSKWGYTRLFQVFRVPSREIEHVLASSLPPAKDAFNVKMPDHPDLMMEDACKRLGASIPPYGIALLLESSVEMWAKLHPWAEDEFKKRARSFDARYTRGPTDPTLGQKRVNEREAVHESALRDIKHNEERMPDPSAPTVFGLGLPPSLAPPERSLFASLRLQSVEPTASRVLGEETSLPRFSHVQAGEESGGRPVPGLSPEGIAWASGRDGNNAMPSAMYQSYVQASRLDAGASLSSLHDMPSVHSYEGMNGQDVTEGHEEEAQGMKMPAVRVHDPLSERLRTLGASRLAPMPGRERAAEPIGIVIAGGSGSRVHTAQDMYSDDRKLRKDSRLAVPTFGHSFAPAEGSGRGSSEGRLQPDARGIRDPNYKPQTPFRGLREAKEGTVKFETKGNLSKGARSYGIGQGQAPHPQNPIAKIGPSVVTSPHGGLVFSGPSGVRPVLPSAYVPTVSLRDMSQHSLPSLN